MNTDIKFGGGSVINAETRFCRPYGETNESGIIRCITRDCAAALVFYSTRGRVWAEEIREIK